MNRSFFIALATIILSVSAAAQSRPARPPSSDFNIELINFEGPSRIEAVPGAGARTGHISTNLHRISEWKSAPGSSGEVYALKVTFWPEGDAVRVEVTAYIGKPIPNPRPADLEKLPKASIATRLVHENETVNVNETEQYGIEPISLRVLRSKPWSIGTPEIINKTQALIVTAITEERPAYHLTARNLSQKCITSIRWYGLDNGNRGGGSGLSGKCIIPAGGPFEFMQRFAMNEQLGAESAQLQSPGRREIVIEAILFEDGTFEGDVDTAAAMAGHLAGEKIQLARTSKLIQGVAGASADEIPEILSKLKRDVTSLGEDVNQTTVEELSLRFANASADMRQRRIGEEIRNGLRVVKQTFLGRIEQFEYKRAHSPEEADFGVWLKEMTRIFDR